MENLTQYESPHEKLLTAGEVADVLNISRAFAYQLMKRGKIRAVFIEGARRVRPEDLRAYIETCLRPQVEG
jgi:excisionase family DNA binding protein